MTSLDLTFGIATLLSLILTCWEMVRSRAKGTVEEAKTRMQLERIRHAKYGVVSAAETIHLLVQVSKEQEQSLSELRNIGRVARGQLMMIIRELEIEEEKLLKWKYGRLFDSSEGKAMAREGSSENGSRQAQDGPSESQS